MNFSYSDYELSVCNFFRKFSSLICISYCIAIFDDTGLFIYTKNDCFHELQEFMPIIIRSICVDS